MLQWDSNVLIKIWATKKVQHSTIERHAWPALFSFFKRTDVTFIILCFKFELNSQKLKFLIPKLLKTNNSLKIGHYK